MPFAKTKADEFMNYKPGGSSGDSEWFKPDIPKTGEVRYHFRLLPPLEGSTSPMYDAPLHYWSVYPNRPPTGVEAGVSPAVKGKEDLATDIFFALRTAYDKDSPQNQAIRALAPTTRVYANVIVREANGVEIPLEEQRPQIWSMTYKTGDSLASLYRDYLELGESVDDVENGRDLVLKIRRTPMVDFSFSAHLQPSSLGLDPDTVADQAPNLKAMAHQRELTSEECREWIKPVLGEFYDEIIRAYEEATGEVIEGSVGSTEELGEVV